MIKETWKIHDIHDCRGGLNIVFSNLKDEDIMISIIAPTEEEAWTKLEAFSKVEQAPTKLTAQEVMDKIQDHETENGVITKLSSMIWDTFEKIIKEAFGEVAYIDQIVINGVLYSILEGMMYE